MIDLYTPLPTKLKNCLAELDLELIDPYFVGGAVRDAFMSKESDDIDICLVGCSNLQLARSIILRYADGITEEVGASFSVLIAHFSGMKIDFALARTEQNTGPHHRDVSVSVVGVSIEDDLARRDLTINAIAIHCLTGNVVDPFNGREAIIYGTAQAPTKAFSEDALRVYRVARFIARFDLTPTKALLDMCKGMASTVALVAKERVGMEFDKMLKQARTPSKFFRFLKELGLLHIHFPEVCALINVQQDPQWHPEGWLAGFFGLSDVPAVASPAKSVSINNGGGLREVLTTSLARDASKVSTARTSGTKTLVNLSSRSLSTTGGAGSFTLLFPPSFGPTVPAQPTGFVGFCGKPATFTNKTIRVMFKVSKSCMKSIMKGAINDLEIIKGIVAPVTVYMMNVLSGSEPFAHHSFHNNPVEPRTAVSEPRYFHVTADVVDFSLAPINSDIIFSFDIKFVRNIDFIHVVKSFCDFEVDDIKTKQIPVIKVLQGDVFEHTMHCMDNATTPLMRCTMLCHDMGKPATFGYNAKGRISARGHDIAGVAPTLSLLGRIKWRNMKTQYQVAKLVELHMFHANQKFTRKNVAPVVRKLAKVGLCFADLQEVCRCDVSGRPPLEKRTPYIGEDIATHLISENLIDPIVTGDMLISEGWEQGRLMGEGLKWLLKMQDRGNLTKENWRTWEKNARKVVRERI